ncbi:DNA polymerase zeta catalytic subunit [Penicillium subrubescens]|uniref:DNA polymerase zeta catalytic subunit n=1 Tax=Penicillium subrubescens TaxID=1316194 RepID=A0A1Q5U3T4_9EURO|nr:DNA polymerase zeta catalytic subunit [Penicillium subrubescens]
MEPFRVRLNCIDHYQATASKLDPPLPFRDDDSDEDARPKVPVIRVFGATERANEIPFYGYHVGYRTFFKVYLLNPVYVTRLADLLHEGAVLKRPLQPYESHLQYIPQWMCDYNLHGSVYMDCGNVMFRRPVPEYLELNKDPTLAKQSHCPLEADVCVQDNLNRRNIKERALHHDFTEFLRPAAFNERLVPSLAGLWQDETRRRQNAWESPILAAHYSAATN